MTMWVDTLIKEYTEGKKDLIKYRDALDRDDLIEKEERKIVGGMISDMTYSLEWMKKGRRPGNRRGADRRSVYQRSAYIEMDIFPSLEEEKKELPNEIKKKMVDVLLEFSDRERECFLMHMSQGFSYAQIAKFIGISRSSVQRYVERAKEKLKQIA